MDAQGVAVFNALPIGVHTIEVPPFVDYEGSTTTARMIEPDENGTFKAFVEITKSGLTVAEVKLNFPEEWTSSDEPRVLEELR